MKITIRALALAAMLAGPLCTAAAAQSDAPATRSRTAGFNLGVFAHRFSGGAEAYEDDSGTGLGVHVGYGVHENVSLFARGALASSDPYVHAPSFEVGHLDLGLRVSPGAPSWPVRPFLQGAVTGRDIHFKNLVSARGLGLTAGGGLEGFVRRDLAIEVGVSRSFVDLVEARSPETDGYEKIADWVNATTTRVEIGVSWHP